MVLVDTNVLVYLMLAGDRTSAAQELFERDADWRSEAFIMVEFSNVLTTYVRIKVLSRDQGLKLLAGAEELVPVLTSASFRPLRSSSLPNSISKMPSLSKVAPGRCRPNSAP